MKGLECRNCDGELSKDNKFCPHCGQKVRGPKLALSSFIKESINTVFNVENKFFQTVLYLFIPAQLSINFFKGIRKRYYHPFRIYFVSILFLFFAISIYDVDSDNSAHENKVLPIELNEVQFDSHDTKQSNKTSSLDSLDSFDADYSNNAELNKNASSRFFKKNQVKRLGRRIVGISNYQNRHLFNQKKYLEKQFDEFKSRPQESSQLLDSLYKNLYFVVETDTISVADTSDIAPLKMDLISQSVLLTFDEQYFANIDSVIISKDLDSWLDKLYLKRQLVLERGDFNNALYGNLTWLLLALVPIHALVLFLMFFRKRKHFIEHYVFLLELYSAIILFLALLLITLGPFVSLPIILWTTFMFGVLFFLFSLRAFYQQKWWLILLKSILLGLLFFVFLVLAVVIFAIMVALFF